jgi:hypothetical protein
MAAVVIGTAAARATPSTIAAIHNMLREFKMLLSILLLFPSGIYCIGGFYPAQIRL